MAHARALIVNRNLAAVDMMDDRPLGDRLRFPRFATQSGEMLL